MTNVKSSSNKILLAIYNSYENRITSYELQNSLDIKDDNYVDMEDYVQNLQALYQNGLIYCPIENCGYKELTTGYYKLYSTTDVPFRLTESGYHRVKNIQ